MGGGDSRSQTSVYAEIIQELLIAMLISRAPITYECVCNYIPENKAKRSQIKTLTVAISEYWKVFYWLCKFSKYLSSMKY